MTERTRPRLSTYTLDLNVICDICERSRPAYNHDKCSRIRQQRKNAHWESVIANQAAKKLQQAKGLRPDRHEDTEARS